MSSGSLFLGGVYTHHEKVVFLPFAQTSERYYNEQEKYGPNDLDDGWREQNHHEDQLRIHREDDAESEGKEAIEHNQTDDENQHVELHGFFSLYIDRVISLHNCHYNHQQTLVVTYTCISVSPSCIEQSREGVSRDIDQEKHGETQKPWQIQSIEYGRSGALRQGNYHGTQDGSHHDVVDSA